MSQMRGKIPIDEVIEWLWEDFGLKVRGGWDEVGRVIVSRDEITPQDVAAFMIGEGLEPDEGAWEAMSVPRGVRGNKKDSGSDNS